jgi:hypothetical protein
MGKSPRQDRSVTQLRVSEEARMLAKIAATFSGVSIGDYVSALIVEGAKRDISERARKLNSAPARASRSAAMKAAVARDG